MSNRFELQIFAADRFSKVFGKASAGAKKTAQDAKRASRDQAKANAEDAVYVRRVVEDQARAATRQAGASTDGIESMFRALRAGAHAMHNDSPMGALAALRFAGPVGAGIGAGAAVAALTLQWANMGATVGRTAQAFGISAQELQLWAAAAKAAGYDADAMQDSIKSVARQVYLVNNAPNEAVQQKLFLANNGIDPTKGALHVFRELSRLMAETTDPQKRQRIGELFGISPDSVLFMTKGLAEIEAGINRVRQAGSAQTLQALDEAERQKQAIGEMGAAWDRLKNNVGGKVSPFMRWVFDDLSNLLSTGKLGRPLTPEMKEAQTVRSAAERRLPADPGDDGRPPELARHPDAQSRMRADLDEARAELARTTNPDARAALQGEVSRMERQLSITIDVRGLPAGATATASGGGNAQVRIGTSNPSAR